MRGCAIPGVPSPWFLGRGAVAFLWRDRGRNLVDAGLALRAAHRLPLGTHRLKMSYMLPHLHNGWQVDQAILSEEDRVVVIRFGHDWDPTCMKMDEVLYSIAEKVKNFAVIYLVDITEVPDFNKMYELYDPCTVMFFFRNKHIMIDLGTGNNNKINWAMEDKQEMIDIIETVYRGARKGRGLVVSPKDYSTKYRY
ncbi:hypothetical protein MJT46_015716 [Ovis ammon polii x Ovis aries]|nr:hypothetical protein MJT46_015716 [Ovis ammon polii x Ovis aries]